MHAAKAMFAGVLPPSNHFIGAMTISHFAAGTRTSTMGSLVNCGGYRTWTRCPIFRLPWPPRRRVPRPASAATARFLAAAARWGGFAPPPRAPLAPPAPAASCLFPAAGGPLVDFAPPPGDVHVDPPLAALIAKGSLAL